MKIAKSTKTLMAALAVASIIATNNSLAASPNTKSARALDPEVPVMKGVTKTNQYGFMFRRHPLLIGVHALEVQGGTIMLSGGKLLDYREKDGPLVGFYCYSATNDKGDAVCSADDGGYMSYEEYAESIGLRRFVRYSNTFQDPNGEMVEAIIGCAKSTPLKTCENYISNEGK